MHQPHSVCEGALSSWSGRDVFFRLHCTLPGLTDLQRAQLQLAGTNGAELSSATEATFGRSFEYLQQAQIDHLWHNVRQLQLLEEHLNHLALLSILRDEQQLFSSREGSSSAAHEGSADGLAADSAASEALGDEIDTLAQRLADQRLAYSLSLDMAAAAAAAESYWALQQQEQQDANAARRLGGLAPLQPDGGQTAADTAAAASTAHGWAGSGPGVDAMSAAECWRSLVGVDADTAGTSGDSSSSSSDSVQAAGCTAIVSRGLLVASGSTSSSALQSAAGSSSGNAASITLTKAMLQQARGQLLVVHVASHSHVASACTLVGVYSKHIAGGKKGKAPASAAPPASLLMEQCCACMERFLSPSMPSPAQFKMPCGHSQCSACLTATLRIATTDSSMLPLRCCGRDMETASLAGVLLGDQEAQVLLSRMEEQLAEHKMFCPSSSCSAFINLDSLQHCLGKSKCSSCDTDICTQCKTSWHVGYSCAQFQALPEELRASKHDLALVQLAEQQHWSRCPKCRFYVELEVGCFHMTCRCGYGFCYVCTARWKSCRCPQWDEGRLVLQARQQVDVQARAENVALNEQQLQLRVQHRVEELRVNHDCRHSWSRQPALAEFCEHCRHFPLFVYCYYCSVCQMVVCNVCRFHRVR